MSKKDKIPGGLADKKKSTDFDPKALAEGIKVELEHTSDKDIAREIAMDHLMEDKNYYKKLKSVEKQDRIDKEPDGKQELDYGKEELDKDKKRKKKKKDEQYHPVNIDEEGNYKRPNPPEAGDLSKIWSKIKKALSSDDAFLNIEDASGLAEAEMEEQQAPPEGDVAPEDIDAGEASQDEVQDQEGEDVAEDYADANPDMAEEDDDISDEEKAQMITDALEEAGMSEIEIAHILEGHGLPIVDPVDQSKISMNDQKAKHQQQSHENDIDHKKRMSDLEREHKKRMQDLEFEEKNTLKEQSGMENEHKKRMLDLEYEQEQKAHKVNDLDVEHKKRMLDLEYEAAKKEKELELEAKRKEIDLKLKHKDAAAKDKHKQNQEVNAVKHKQKLKDAKRDAATTSKAEREGKLEKSTSLWTHNKETGQLNHPEHGSIAFLPHEKGVEIKHNGKSVGVHSDKKSALAVARNYMVGLSKPIKA